MRKILLICFSVTLLYATAKNIVSATQGSTAKVVHEKSQTISGKVTEVITSAGFTYTEVDIGKEKVWVAGPGTIALEKGDVISFSAEMPVKNFHSKSLERDFSIIYFINQYVTGKGTSVIAEPHGQLEQQQKTNTVMPSFTGTRGEVKRGDYLREARMDGLNVEDNNLSDFKGKPLIINVWASWCGPCRAEMGSLQRLAKKYNGKEFNVIGISTDDYHQKASAFIEQTGITFKNYLDSELVLENMLGANTIPLTILVDGNGRVLEKVRGAREWDSIEIIDAIGEVFQLRLKHQEQ